MTTITDQQHLTTKQRKALSDLSAKVGLEYGRLITYITGERTPAPWIAAEIHSALANASRGQGKAQRIPPARPSQSCAPVYGFQGRETSPTPHRGGGKVQDDRGATPVVTVPPPRLNQAAQTLGSSAQGGRGEQKSRTTRRHPDHGKLFSPQNEKPANPSSGSLVEGAF